MHYRILERSGSRSISDQVACLRNTGSIRAIIQPARSSGQTFILLVHHALQLIAQFVNGALFPPMLMPPVVIHTVFTILFAFYHLKLRRAGM